MNKYFSFITEKGVKHTINLNEIVSFYYEPSGTYSRTYSTLKIRYKSGSSEKIHSGDELKEVYESIKSKLNDE